MYGKMMVITTSMKKNPVWITEEESLEDTSTVPTWAGCAVHAGYPVTHSNLLNPHSAFINPLQTGGQHEEGGNAQLIIGAPLPSPGTSYSQKKSRGADPGKVKALCKERQAPSSWRTGEGHVPKQQCHPQLSLGEASWRFFGARNRVLHIPGFLRWSEIAPSCLGQTPSSAWS